MSTLQGRTAPSRAEQGVRRTERYVYNSLHWAFPILGAVALIVVTGDAPPQWSVPWAAVVLVAAWAGLVVLHTRLRDADLLPPSGWDAVRTRRVAAARLLWISSGLICAVTAGFVFPPAGFLLALSSATLGSVLAMPMLAYPRIRPVMVGVAGIVLGQFGVWVGPHPGGVEEFPRVVVAYWSAFATGLLLGYAVMFRNVLTTTRELEWARVDTARLAVAEERLRFSRDLHDVFGRTLATVALKAELAAEQASRGRPESVTTMREVQSIATEALDEVRDVVRGYRETDLVGELAGARSLLEASGIEVTTATEGAGGLPAPVARAFAWVVREGTTNILRHADAARVRIVLSSEPGRARLEIDNDHPHPATGGVGSGLTGLGERLAEVGGRLSVDHRPDGFTLIAEVSEAALDRLRTASGSSHAGGDS